MKVNPKKGEHFIKNPVLGLLNFGVLSFLMTKNPGFLCVLGYTFKIGKLIVALSEEEAVRYSFIAFCKGGANRSYSLLVGQGKTGRAPITAGKPEY